MIKKHRLEDRDNEKASTITLNENVVTIETEKSGKARATEKTFTYNNEASEYFEKKEWELLKKGFVLHSDSTMIGDPILHYFIGGFFTGALSFEETLSGIFIYKANGDGLDDELMVINEVGKKVDAIKLPEPLVWDIKFNKDNDSLLLDIDHHIYQYSMSKKHFTDLTGRCKQPGSFITISSGNIAYASLPKLIITNAKMPCNLMVEISASLYGGHTHICCAALSSNGNTLALHLNAGEIQLLNTNTGKLIKTINDDFTLLRQMEFINNDTQIVALEQYGKLKMCYFDIASGEKVNYNELEMSNISKFCVSKTSNKLVILSYKTVYVYDILKKELLTKFKIIHMIKTANVKFIGEKLGVRTDYGCFSIYNV